MSSSTPLTFYFNALDVSLNMNQLTTSDISLNLIHPDFYITTDITLADLKGMLIKATGSDISGQDIKFALDASFNSNIFSHIQDKTFTVVTTSPPDFNCNIIISNQSSWRWGKVASANEVQKMTGNYRVINIYNNEDAVAAQLESSTYTAIDTKSGVVYSGFDASGYYISNTTNALVANMREVYTKSSFTRPTTLSVLNASVGSYVDLATTFLQSGDSISLMANVYLNSQQKDLTGASTSSITPTKVGLILNIV